MDIELYGAISKLKREPWLQKLVDILNSIIHFKKGNQSVLIIDHESVRCKRHMFKHILKIKIP